MNKRKSVLSIWIILASIFGAMLNSVAPVILLTLATVITLYVEMDEDE